MTAKNVGVVHRPQVNQTRLRSIRISMPEEVFFRLKKRAKKERHAGIASLLLAAVDEQNETSTTMDVVKQAVKLTQKKKVGVPFRLRDLFEARRWDSLEKGVRIRAGRQFYAAIQMGDLPVRPIESDGHQFYVRTPSRTGR